MRRYDSTSYDDTAQGFSVEIALNSRGGGSRQDLSNSRWVAGKRVLHASRDSVRMNEDLIKGFLIVWELVLVPGAVSLRNPDLAAVGWSLF